MSSTPEPHPRHQRLTFFRQSGWLMVANILGGALMWGVHFLSKKIPESEYGTLGKLLAVTMILPGLPLQMIFARATAAALARGQTHALAAQFRQTLAVLVGLWLVAAAAVLWFQADILAHWKVAHASALWIMLLVVLVSLLSPVINGGLQGQQNFLWMGGTLLLSGVGRLAGAALLVFFVSQTAAGIMGGVLAGLLLAGGVAAWQTRALWTGSAQAYDRGAFLREVMPLVVGFGACQFLFSADTIFVGWFFGADDTGFYTSAGTLSRALIWLVMPLATVMFPKLVHSTARAEKSNVFELTLLSTAALAACGVVGLVVLGPWVVRFVNTPAYVPVVTHLLPWYAGAMVPLSLANLLVNNLLAKGDFRAVPVIFAVAVAYGITLSQWHPSLIGVLQTLAFFTTLLFGVCALFTWVWKPKRGPQASID